MIAPNKQNLILLGAQKKVTQSGYKLLKEKRAGLITYFLELSKTGKSIELELNTNHLNRVRLLGNFFSIYDIYELNDYLLGNPCSYLHISKKRVSGVYVDSIHIEVASLIKKNLKSIVSHNLRDFSHTFPLLIKLAQLKLNCKNLAAEILKTNRQIASLDKKIEEINNTIKYIKAVLSDKENLEKGILLKLFV
jgi:vacuolar-type H+-ATPase subunit D/Vma8